MRRLLVLALAAAGACTSPPDMRSEEAAVIKAAFTHVTKDIVIPFWVDPSTLGSDRPWRARGLAGQFADLGLADDTELLVAFDSAMVRPPLAIDSGQLNHARLSREEGPDIAILRFARPVFDEALTRALMYTELDCGLECAGGGFLVLSLTRDGWQVVGDVPWWES